MKITPLKVLRIDVGKTLRLSVAFPVYRMSRYGVQEFPLGYENGKLQLEPVRRCLDALEELEPLAMYQEDPPL
ncbi:hypothetical protein TNCV_2425831 [Trichonephila clavipes]|nr:hypothetical protein TNCV_2425831 [Trichonephila clavipes]